MRRLIICTVLILTALGLTRPAAAEGCEVIRIHVPPLPPTEIEICPEPPALP